MRGVPEGKMSVVFARIRVGQHFRVEKMVEAVGGTPSASENGSVARLHESGVKPALPWALSYVFHVLILKEDKVVCFVSVLSVLILNKLRADEKTGQELGGKWVPPGVFCKNVIQWELRGGGLQKM